MAKDEAYVIDLCDRVLGRKAVRQHRFDFLRGDTGRPLPVDAYYPDLRLVIEYRERQHSDAVTFWDRKPTISGVPRGQQRAMYDQRRRDVLPQHGITVVELCSSDFECDGRKRLLRLCSKDEQVVRAKLAKWTIKRRVIHSEAELGPLAVQIAEAATSAVACVVEICAAASPLDALRRIKFESVGFDPLGPTRLNLIEQINQTFTYLATLKAVRYLFGQHAESGPFTINLGTAPGPDISSQDCKVIAEVFAAVAPDSNQKLKKDTCKVSSAQAEHRYVFYACPGVAQGDMPALKDYPGVRIVSLGVAFGADLCAT